MVTWVKSPGSPHRYFWAKDRQGGEGAGNGHHNYRSMLLARCKEEGGIRAMEIARDALGRAAGPYFRKDAAYLQSWWDWVLGSTPFFWNWPARYCQEVRDGQRHFLIGEFGSFVRPQLACKTPQDTKLFQNKAVAVQFKNYIVPGDVSSLIHYFYAITSTA